MNITIGADPEFFIQRGRHFMSAHDLPFGTKKKPMATEHGSVQVDGMALEVNVKPAASRSEFVTNMRNVRTDLEKLLYDWEPAAKIVVRPSVFFGRRKIGTIPPQSAMLGCDADYNAYTGHKNSPPNSGLPFRTGAGHVHIAWTKDAKIDGAYMKTCAALAKELDYFLGLPSLLWDKDARRRELYGQAGAFRPKPYGMEYRVLSNKWTDTDKHVGWVFDRAVAATKRVFNASESRLADRYGMIASNYINTSNPAWVDVYSALAAEVLQ